MSTAMAAPHRIALDDEKAAARRRLRRASRPFDAGANDALIRRLVFLLGDVSGLHVAATWPLPSEPDLRPLLAGLDEAGAVVLLPRIHAPAMPLAFDRWRNGMTMLPGALGTSQPASPAADRDLTPDIILVPLVAFDRRGGRLGRGGGFYDRTLRAHPGARVIGVGSASCEVASVPMGLLDVRLDLIVTEGETIRTGARG